jgi:molybdopterin-containing oxidoreductase family membrane subunit
VVILSRKKTRTITGTTIASLAICAGMWIERFTIVVPTLERPRLPGHATSYFPSFTEIAMMAGGFSLFALMYLVFTRLFPVVSLWEM